MENKRGAAHFEMIIAFIFFMGFVAFLFIILRPYDTKVLSSSVVDGVFDSFSDEVSIEFTKFFLRSEGTATNCHNATLLLELFNYELAGVKSFDLNNDPKNSNIDGDKIYLDDLPGYFYVYSAETFEENDFICNNDGEDTDPRIGSVTQKKVFSLAKLKELEESYINDYEQTKIVLGVPDIYEFSIKSNDVGISMEREVPETGDVLAKDFLVEVLDEGNTQIINSRFTLTIW